MNHVLGRLTVKHLTLDGIRQLPCVLKLQTKTTKKLQIDSDIKHWQIYAFSVSKPSLEEIEKMLNQFKELRDTFSKTISTREEENW